MTSFSAITRTQLEAAADEAMRQGRQSDLAAADERYIRGALNDDLAEILHPHQALDAIAIAAEYHEAAFATDPR